MEDFELAEIKVNAFSDEWGPFIFLIPAATAETANDGLIPFGTAISSATVRAFVGSISPGTDLTELTEITSTIIGPTAPVVQANRVSVRFSYPTSLYGGKSVSLVFICVLDNGATQAFYFQSVSVQ